MSGDALLMESLELVGGRVLNAFMTTLRWRHLDEHQDRLVHRMHGPVIWAFWHGELVLPAYVGRNRSVRILISKHRDGELVSRIAKGLGYDVARGSSTRGGMRALRGLARSISSEDIAITPDGPAGPRRHARQGVVLLAQLTGRPIMPFAAAAHPSRNLNSWDRFTIPLPFSTATCVWGDPILVPPNLDTASRETYRARLEAELLRLTARAEEACLRRTPTGKRGSVERPDWEGGSGGAT